MQILVIEDEKRLAQTIQKGLKSDGFMVDVAYDGKEGIRMLVNKYDVIILDLMLPEIDGLAVLESIRAKYPLLPVLILTAKDSTQDKVKGLDLGADDYLAKPFDFEELVARVHALIRRSTQSTSVLHIDSLELNPRTKVVKRNGQLVTLSATEYRLLEYLMLHHNAVLSETDLLEHVWDHSYDGLSNVVSVYIRYVRNKVDKAFPKEKKLIHTVRGLGYTLSDQK